MQEIIVKYAAFDKTKPYSLPIRGTEGSAGFDLRTPIDVELKPHTRLGVDLNISHECPIGFVGVLSSRSGLALKNGVRVFFAPCWIDSDYRGSIIATMENTTDETFHFKAGDKIAQIVYVLYFSGEIHEVDYDDLTQTTRGVGGHGSTGK